MPDPASSSDEPQFLARRPTSDSLAEAHAASDGPTALQRALDAHMPFEFVHVQETNERTGKHSLVVIGLE